MHGSLSSAFRRLATLVLAAAALSAANPTISSAQEKVVIFAAASLKNAVDDIVEDWETRTGKTAAVSYAGSSTLAKQIEQGAPADIFMSADLEWMGYLSGKGLTVKESERVLLGNRLALVAPTDSQVTAKISPGFDLADVLGDGRLAMANVDAVPAGKYGKAALETLGVWDSVSGRVAQADNVRAALALVAAGETPLGIVYETDAAAEPAVRILDRFPEDSHPPILYPVARIAGSENPGAMDLMEFLLSSAARRSFERQGFTWLGPIESN